MLNNQTQGYTSTIPWSFTATVHLEEIFVFCLSRSFTQELHERFNAVLALRFSISKHSARDLSLPYQLSPHFPESPVGHVSGRQSNIMKKQITAIRLGPVRI